MASGTSPVLKRNSFHKLSHILQFASPSFSRRSSDSGRRRSSRKSSSTKADGVSSPPAVPQRIYSEARESFNPTASVVSAANSCLSSPQIPLLANSLGLADYELPVPPTTNELATDEKMKLIRKARKLSRVLGEVPVGSAADVQDSSTESSPRLSDVAESPFISKSPYSGSPSSTKIHTVSASAKKAFRRSLTFVQNASSSSLQVHDVQRSKSFSTLRPSLQIPSTSSLCADAPPYSPIMFASSPHTTPSETSIAATGSSLAKEERNECAPVDTKRRDSTSSSCLSVDITEQPLPSPEQRQRQQMAKLTRHLGDNIPAEVLLRVPSPPVSRKDVPSLYSIRDPNAVLSADNLYKRPEPFVDMSKLRRRPISMEFPGHRKSGAVSAPVTPLVSPTSFLSGFPTVRLRKPSQATVARSAHQPYPLEIDPVDSGDLDLSSEPLSEKQRLLNVKRAKKMTQYFGDNPPTALFQITNFGPSYLNERDSVATFISITTSSVSSLAGGAGSKLRDSFISVVTASSDISAVPLQEDSEELDADSDDDSVESEHDLADERQEVFRSEAPPVPLLSPAPFSHRNRIARPESSHGPSRPLGAPARAQGTRNLSAPPLNQLPRTPPTPPPFSNFIDKPLPKPPTTSIDMGSTDFHARRRRAAKLSKFFGVEVNTLVEALPTEIPPAASPCQDHYSFDLPPQVGDGVTRAPSLTVAEAKNRRRFLGAAEDNDVKELDMTEVIEQLRRMKSH